MNKALLSAVLLLSLVSANADNVNTMGLLQRSVGARMLSSKQATHQRTMATSMSASQFNSLYGGKQQQQSNVRSAQPQMLQFRSQFQSTQVQPMGSSQVISTQFVPQQQQQFNQIPQMNPITQEFRSSQQQPMQFQQQPIQQQQQPIQQQQQPIQQQQQPIQQQQQPIQQIQQQQQPATNSFCMNANLGDIVPHPTNHHQFVMCFTSDEFTIMDCPADLVYNRILQRCDHDLEPHSDPCASSPCQNGGKCVNVPSKFTYVCECPAGFSGENCDKSNSCSAKSCGTPDGVCVEMSQGSPIPNVCRCSGGAAYGITCTQNVEANPCFQPTSHSVKFPTKLDPSVFIQCQGKKPHFMFCQQGLVFSMMKQACDWNL